MDSRNSRKATATEPAGLPLIAVHNPADGRIVGSVSDESAASVGDTARALREAQPEWEALGPKGRARWLFELQAWLLDHSAHIADVLQAETGKPRADAEFEVPAWVDLINYFARTAGKRLADERPNPHSPIGWTKKLTTVFRPYPLVGIITPWNFPLAMPGLDVPPALMAGAAVLLLAAVLVAPTLRAFLNQQLEISAAREEIAAMQAQREDYERRIQLWDDPAYVTQQARERLELVMPGETLYSVTGRPSETDTEAEDTPAAGADEVVNTRLPWAEGLWDSAVRAGLE